MPKFQLQPANDPTRKDWGILSGLCQRPLPVPADEKEAIAALKEASMEAYKKDPRALVLACCNREKGCLPGYFQSYGNSPGKVGEIIDFCVSRLYNVNQDGSEGAAKDPSRGPSSRALEYWQPERAGIAAYVNQRVAWVMQRQWFVEQSQSKHVSIERLAAAGRDFDQNGQMVRQMPSIGEVDEANIDISSLPSRLERVGATDEETSEVVSEADIEAEMANAEYDDEPDEKEVEAIGRHQALQFLATAHRVTPPDLRSSPHRSDFSLFALALGRPIEPATSAEERYEQLKELAAETVNLRCFESTEFESIKEASASWDPTASSYADFMPDVIDITASQINAGRTLVEIRDKAELAFASRAQSGFAFLDQPETSPSPSPSTTHLVEAPLTIADRFRLAGRSVKDAELWNARCHDLEDLNDTSRPDYRLFCELRGTKPNHNLSPNELHEAMKAMVLDLANKLSLEPHHSRQCRLLAESLQAYDPAKDGFVTEIINEWSYDALRPEQGARAPVFSEPLPDELSEAPAGAPSKRVVQPDLFQIT